MSDKIAKPKSKTLERDTLAPASGTSRSSSIFKKSKSLDRKKVKFTRKSGNKSAQELAKSNKPSDNERLQNLLENLQIRYKSCTFTYKASHLSPETENACKEKDGKPDKPSRLSRLSKKVVSTLERISDSVCEVVDCEKDFKDCLFVPSNKEANVKEFIKENNSFDIKITFDSCKFIERDSTIYERIGQKLRKFFGIIFELDYLTSVVDVVDCTFRLKDIQSVSSYVEQTLVEKA